MNDISQLEEYVNASALVLSFLSRGYCLSRNCQRELRAARESNKPMLLVHENDADHGGAPLSDLQLECSDDLRAFVFATENRVVPWARTSHFQTVCHLVSIHGHLCC